MLGKLLKKDLSRNMRWLWILFVATLGVALVGRICKELGTNIVLFKILGIIFDSVFYALLVNVILQPFLRNFLNFTTSLYKDECYLTHTLPVTKTQIINSKFLTAIIEIVLGFVVLVASLLIMFFTDSIAHFLFKYVSQIFGEEVILLFALFFIYVILRIVCAVIPVRQSAKRN